jgi:hypothetical protein
MQRPRLISLILCALLLLAALLGCKMLGKNGNLRSSTNKNDRASGSSDKSGDNLTQKTNLYIKECVNKYSSRVMDSYQRYASWLHDIEQGPTGRESIVYGLYDVSDDGQDCINAINKAKSMDPSLPEAEGAADTYASALKEAIKQIKAIYPYYDHEDYKDDGFQRGKEAHGALLAAFKNFQQANRNFDDQVDKLEDEVANKNLEEFKNDPARKYDYAVVDTGVKAKKIVRLVRQTDFSHINVDELQPLIDDFEKSVEALKTAGAKKTMSSFYVSSCDDFLKAAKELMRRVRDKKPFTGMERNWVGTASGWMVEGSPDKLIHQYNEMIQRRGMSNI